MMTDRGHNVHHYGHELSQVTAQHHTVITDDFFQQCFPDYDWRTRMFTDFTDQTGLLQQTFEQNCVSELTIQAQPGDFLICFWGWGHKRIADASPDLIAVEPGIGYGHHWARWRTYESATLRASLQGPEAVNHCIQDWYQPAIPGFIDISDFEYSDTKHDYILYLGRIYSGKGVDIAIQATELAGRRLLIAGQGSLTDMGYLQTPDHVELVGQAGPEQRRRLMRDASALVIASRYAEPFGNVMVEAWASGTPTITPDWASFAEYNRTDVTGRRCRTLRDWVDACQNTQGYDHQAIRAYSEQFDIGPIGARLERYFSDILDVYAGDGWLQLTPLPHWPGQ